MTDAKAPILDYEPPPKPPLTVRRVLWYLFSAASAVSLLLAVMAANAAFQVYRTVHNDIAADPELGGNTWVGVSYRWTHHGYVQLFGTFCAIFLVLPTAWIIGWRARRKSATK